MEAGAEHISHYCGPEIVVSSSSQSHLHCSGHYSNHYSSILFFQTIIRSKTHYLVIISSLILYQGNSAAACKLCSKSFLAKGFYPCMCNMLDLSSDIHPKSILPTFIEMWGLWFKLTATLPLNSRETEIHLQVKLNDQMDHLFQRIRSGARNILSTF